MDRHTRNVAVTPSQLSTFLSTFLVLSRPIFRGFMLMVIQRLHGNGVHVSVHVLSDYHAFRMY